jgi:metal-responsive CopG/Arc/MetJ family transcriptional regulator
MASASQKRAVEPAGRAKKISITLDERVLAEMRGRMKKKRGSSLSSTIAEALQRDLRREKLAAIVAKYEAQHGTLSGAEVEEARRKWRG